MQWVRKKFLLLIILLIVYGFYFATHLSTSTPQKHVLGATDSLFLFTEPENGRTELLQEIGNAKKEILVEVYLLSDKQIITALIQAKDRGIMEKVMLEEHPFGGGNINSTTYNQLQSNNVQVAWTSPSFALTHEKAIIIDGREVFVLNQNLTAASFGKNREFDILDTSPEDVAESRNIFLSDWDRKNVTLFPQSHLIVSPENSRQNLESLISSATKTINIEMEILDDEQIISLLSQKAKTVQIEIIIPDGKAVAANIPFAKELETAGIKVRTMTKPYIHAKLLVVDGGRAYVGSVNFSKDSMDHNRELGIILTEPSILFQLSTDFDADWQNASDFLQ